MEADGREAPGKGMVCVRNVLSMGRASELEQEIVRDQARRERDRERVDMKILALDLATKTGWAHSDGPHGVFDLRIARDESSGMRLIRFERSLRAILEGPGVDLIAFEAVPVHSSRPGHATNYSVMLASKLQGIVERLVEETEGLECCSYNMQEIKRHAIPEKGRKRDKEAMVKAAEKRWPSHTIEDDNVADALWILDLAQEDLER
jgi:hypothetical protein